jgi:hypothetical protein
MRHLASQTSSLHSNEFSEEQAALLPFQHVTPETEPADSFEMDSDIEKKSAAGSIRDDEKFVDAIAHEKDAERNASVVAQNILKHSHDTDAAFKAFAAHQGAVIEIDEATNRRLLRTIDWHLMPVRSINLQFQVKLGYS